MKKRYVGIDTELIDGMTQVRIHTKEVMSMNEIQEVLVSALTLSIKLEKSDEEQIKNFKKIVRFIEGELFKEESFKDAVSYVEE